MCLKYTLMESNSNVNASKHRTNDPRLHKLEHAKFSLTFTTDRIKF